MEKKQKKGSLVVSESPQMNHPRSWVQPRTWIKWVLQLLIPKAIWKGISILLAKTEIINLPFDDLSSLFLYLIEILKLHLFTLL